MDGTALLDEWQAVHTDDFAVGESCLENLSSLFVQLVVTVGRHQHGTV